MQSVKMMNNSMKPYDKKHSIMTSCQELLYQKGLLWYKIKKNKK